MEDRKKGDVAMASMMGDEVRGYLARMQYGDLFQSWKKWNLARMGFKPNSGFEAEEPGDTDEADDEGAVPED